MRDPDTMAHVTPLLDAGMLPVAILATGSRQGGPPWFVSASYPADAGLYDGIYHFEFGDSIDDCVEKILAWYEQYWNGL